MNIGEPEQADCCVCHVPIFMSPETMRNLRAAHDDFHCLNGHLLLFRAESDADKFKQAAKLAREENARLNQRLRELNGTIRALKEWNTRRRKQQEET